jgi:CBS domain-containing protein
MSQFAVDVSTYMTSAVSTVTESATLEEVNAELSALDVSALPVLDAQGRAAGVISRTDLLRAGRVHVDEGTRRHTLKLPDARVREFMTATVEVVTPSTPLWDAARRMVRQHYHRLFVAEDSRLIGVISTREMMRAIAEVRLATPVSEITSGSVVKVKADDPLALAVDRMAAAHRSGLVVVQGDWPVGVFTQVEALEARDANPQAPVHDWMDMRVLSLPTTMPVHMAAGQALATGARRLLTIETLGVAGIATGMDFTQLVSDSHKG